MSDPVYVHIVHTYGYRKSFYHLSVVGIHERLCNAGVSSHVYTSIKPLFVGFHLTAMTW